MRTKFDKGGIQRWLPNDQPQAMMDLHRLYRWSGDVMYCRECKRGVHISRLGETMNHAEGCEGQEDLNPWQIIKECLGV